MDVSVIVPTYRRDWELKRALKSLLEQDFLNFEIIIVDDNCDPAWNQTVMDIMEALKHACPAIMMKYVRNQVRLGSAESRNAGVLAAEGAYITFLDDDDEYLCRKIPRQYVYMVKHGLDYSITDLDLYYENGKLSERRCRSYIERTDCASLLEYHLVHHLTGTDAIMIRKDYFVRIGGFPPIDVGDEFYLMLRAIEGGGKFGYLCACDIRAYVHTGEISLSCGEGKRTGENRLYEYKKRYFHRLNPRTVRYIRMRHYAVLCFAGYRMGNYWYFLLYGALSAASAPVQCIQLLIQRYRKDRTYTKVKDEGITSQLCLQLRQYREDHA